MTPQALTPAQARVLSHIALGKSVDETATELGVASTTVVGQLSSISHKLGVRGRAALVHAAYLTEQISRPQRETFDGEFTDTEIQVWRLAASGASTQDMAHVCGFSGYTPRRRIKDLRQRLDAANDPHLVTLGWRYGVVDESLTDVESSAFMTDAANG